MQPSYKIQLPNSMLLGICGTHRVHRIYCSRLGNDMRTGLHCGSTRRTKQEKKTGRRVFIESSDWETEVHFKSLRLQQQRVYKTFLQSVPEVFWRVSWVLFCQICIITLDYLCPSGFLLLFKCAPGISLECALQSSFGKMCNSFHGQ